MHLASHRQCLAVGELFRGKLCDRLKDQAGRKFAAGEFIFLRGDPARSVCYLRSGLVKSSVLTEHGAEVIVAIHKPEEIFGELCFCTGERREQAQAMEQTEVVEIALNDLLARMQADRQVMWEFLTSISEHLAKAYDQVEMLAFETTLRRLGRRLLQLGGEFGKPTADGLEIQHYIRQEELAQMIGVSREVASIALNHLRTSGLVSYTRKGRITLNTERLQTYLSSPDR